MTPRGTDWGLAALVALLGVTGMLTAFAGTHSRAWVFVAHGTAGFALALLLAPKLKRVRRRLRAPHAGVVAATVVLASLGSGLAWSSGVNGALAGYSLLAWHDSVGALLVLAVVVHAALRAKRPRRRDVADRRQFLVAAGMAAGAIVAYEVQRPLDRALGWAGAGRRFTGSYDARGDFPVTSWVADAPRVLDPVSYRLAIAGAVRTPLELRLDEIDGGDELTATLDCTGGFAATRPWRGARLLDVVQRADPLRGATHVRVISHTGYRWSYALADARDLLLATHVADEPLSHGHGAPVRLVAPGHRGFQWVKWVVRLELADGPDPGALPSTVWSSLTPEGRGAA